LIKERTHEGLMARKRAGHKLGRPEGSKNKSYVLDEHKDKIIKMLNKGVPKTKIAKKFKVHTSTLYDFLKRHGLYSSK
jgi:DNA invertase Pin-like site-specific DNA recombinase